MSELTFEPILDSTIAVIALAFVGLAIIAGIRPQGTDVSPNKRRRLILLRLLAMVVLFLALLRPSIIRHDTRPASATLGILIDQSRSMNLPVGDGSSRWVAARAFTEKLATGLDSLDGDLDIRYFGFGQDVNVVPRESLTEFLQGDADSPSTDMGLALRSALSSASGRPLAGVIMVGDGTSTVPRSNPAVSAQTLNSLEVPLWTVPLGPRQSDQQLRDCAIEEMPESFKVFAKNLFRVTGIVKTRGLQGTPIPVTLSLIDTKGQESQLASREVVPKGSEEASVIDIEIPAPMPGNYRLKMTAATQSGESLTENNSQVAFLDVREGGGRILYLEGEPRYEQLYLRRSLNDSPDFELNYVWIDRATSDQWPVDLGDSLEPGKYDVYILGDVHADAFGKAALQKLADRVDEGSGLLMTGGQHSFDAGGYANTPLALPLPVRMDAKQRVSAKQPAPDATQLTQQISPIPSLPHPITQLTTKGDNAEVWRRLKPLLGANRWLGPKVSPGISVLLESSASEPLLVVGQFGAGRTAAFAGDSTWQWWLQGQSDVHRRFWRQLLLWLLARDAPAADTVWAQLSSRRFNRSEPATLVAGIQTLSEEKGSLRFTAEVVGEDGRATPVVLQKVPASVPPDKTAPAVTGTLPELPGGIYTLRVSAQGASVQGNSAQGNSAQGNGAQGNGAKFDPAEILFQVLDIDIELSNPVAEISRMEQLAALTESAGGRSFRADQVNELIEQIQSIRQKSELPVVEKFRLGDDRWSGWILTTLFVGLLGLEWYYRKSWGMA